MRCITWFDPYTSQYGSTKASRVADIRIAEVKHELNIIIELNKTKTQK
jgi:hypothetical protein